MSSISPTLEPSKVSPTGPHLTFRWTINNYSQLCSGSSSTVAYPCFTSSTFSSIASQSEASQFRLTLFPRGINANLRDYVSIGLVGEKIRKELQFTVRLSLVNTKTGDLHHTKECMYMFYISKTVTAIGRFITQSDLLDASNGFVLDDDKLVIHCEMTLYIGSSTLSELDSFNRKTKKEYKYELQLLNNICQLETSDLVYFCEEGIPKNLCNRVNVENAISMLTLAHSACDDELKRVCLEFVSDHVHLVIWRTSWNDDFYSEAELVVQMYHCLALKRAHTESSVQAIQVELPILQYIEQQQQQVWFDEATSQTTRKCYQQKFVTQINVENSRCIRSKNHRIPNYRISNYRMSYIPRVVCRDDRQFDWHEFKVAFDANYFKFDYPHQIVTVHIRVSLIDRENNRRFSSDKWIHPGISLFTRTRKRDIMKVRGFVSDRVLRDATNRLLSNDGQLTIEAKWSVYESNDIDYNRCIRKGILEDLRRSFGKGESAIAAARRIDANQLTGSTSVMNEAKNEPIPNVSFEAWNLLSGYFYDDIGDGGDQKRWETDLLVFVAKYGFRDYWEGSAYGFLHVQQIVNENVLKLLYYSNLCGFNRLPQFCIQFIVDHANETVSIDYWNEVASSRPELLILMFSLLATSKHQHNESASDRKKFNRKQKVYHNLPEVKVSNRIEETFSYTHPTKYHIHYDWTIGNFINKLLFPDCQLVSPKFFTPEKSCLKFRIVKSSSRLKEKIFAFDLVLKHKCWKGVCPEKEDAIIRYNVSFHNVKGKMTSRDYIRNLAIGSPYICLKNELCIRNGEHLLEYYYRNMHETNQLNISCDITLLCDIEAYDLTKTTTTLELSQLVEQSKKHLRDCLNSLMHDGKQNGDVTLVVDGTEFKAHSLFLAQSSVLEELVAQSNRIHIPDLSIEAFEPFLQYLCTGKVQSLDKYAKELMIVASKCKLNILMQMCDLELNQYSV